MSFKNIVYRTTIAKAELNSWNRYSVGTKPWTFTIWPFRENVCWPLFYGMEGAGFLDHSTEEICPLTNDTCIIKLMWAKMTCVKSLKFLVIAAKNILSVKRTILGNWSKNLHIKNSHISGRWMVIKVDGIAQGLAHRYSKKI